MCSFEIKLSSRGLYIGLKIKVIPLRLTMVITVMFSPINLMCSVDSPLLGGSNSGMDKNDFLMLIHMQASTIEAK